MTAIFGILKYDQTPIPPEKLRIAAETMRYHAADGLELWQEGPLGLGQALTRFWINSARTPAPEHDRERGLTLVADARLDNRAELANSLQISRADLAQIPDNALILHAYKAWGKDCPKYLLGDFVFAVWDAHNQTLFAARDQIGINWLYYATGPRQLAFSSDIAGLLGLMDEAPRINPHSLDEYLTFPYNVSSNRTFYENVHKLQPGQSLLAADGSLKTWYYWQAENIQPDPKLNDPRKGIEILSGLLSEAVACRAETVDRLGSHLSGGLDSSAITALAVEINRKAGRPAPFAYSWSPPLEMLPLQENDERIYVQRIAEYLNIPVTYTHVPPKVDILHEVSDPSILPLNTVRFEQTVMENARGQGARVLLSGWGGDELIFSRGIGYPSGLIKQGRWLALARYLKNQYGWHPKRWVGGLYTHGFFPLLPVSWQMRLPFRLRREREINKHALEQALSKIRSALPSPGFFQADFYTRLEQNHKPKFEWIRPGLRESQRWYLGILLNRIESWASWSARLGARHAYPLLDRRLVEFAISMPEDWVYYGGKLREFGKQAVHKTLPMELFNGRDKQDRALAAYQKTIEHKREVNKGRLETFEAHWKTKPPVTHWLDFEYIHQVLLIPPATEDQPLPPEQPVVPRIGMWQIINLAFLDPRATFPEEI